MASPEQIALGLYVVISRDACDFLDMLNEETDVEAIKTLYLMFATPNPKSSERDRELNRLGASLVKSHLLNRGIPLPAISEPPTIPPEQGSLF
jgi:hypothetical protein